MSHWVVSILEVFAVGSGSLESSADLSLVIAWHLLLDDLKSLVDESFNGLLRAGQDPDVLGLGKQVWVARVYDSEVLIVSIEHTVVTGGGIREELDLTLGSDEGGNGSSASHLVGLGVVLRVKNSDSTIGIDGVASLLAIVGFPRKVGFSGLLVPQSHVGLGLEVLLELRSGALASWDACVDESDEGKGSDDESLEHSIRNFTYYYKTFKLKSLYRAENNKNKSWYLTQLRAQ